MNWLITGGCGFLGTSLILKLAREGGPHNIRIIDNLSVGSKEDLAKVCNYTEKSPAEPQSKPSGIELFVEDILDSELAQSITKGIDIIVHFAGNTGVPQSVDDPRTDCMSNVIGTFNYLEAARKNKIQRFVFASSGAPAGEVEPPIHEEMPAHPVSPYGASKLAGEGYCSAYNRSFGIETVVLRFGNVYGPGSIHKGSVVAKFIKQALAGETLEIYGDGGQTRDFIYIDDLIDAVCYAATVDNIGGEIFQIATNKETTVGEMTLLLIECLNKSGITYTDVKNGELRRGDVMRNFSDTSKAQKYLGWKAKVALEEGLKKTIDYFSPNKSNKTAS